MALQKYSFCRARIGMACSYGARMHVLNAHILLFVVIGAVLHVCKCSVSGVRHREYYNYIVFLSRIYYNIYAYILSLFFINNVYYNTGSYSPSSWEKMLAVLMQNADTDTTVKV